MNRDEDVIMVRSISLAMALATLTLLSVPTPTLAAPAERCIITDPTGTPLNVRRYDGKIIWVLYNGEIVRIRRVGADRNGKPWAHVAYETNGAGWVYRKFISCY
jgi:hypothetical protein